uniref:histidine kinase n=1 Tax=Magnetococcus massalia (strain MO-1) TaxID=451514 RepID=A0A1S7LGR9_MAGMO|nr:putative Histidine kinase with KisKA domain and HATPase c domain and Response regulator receiver domain [Candidatus Magnetococcus massalia]
MSSIPLPNRRTVLVLLLLLLVISYVFMQGQISALSRDHYRQAYHEMSDQLTRLMEAKRKSTLAITLAIAREEKLRRLLQNPHLSTASLGAELAQLSKKFRTHTKYKNVWLQLINAQGVSLSRSWSEKRGDSLRAVRSDVRAMLQSPRVMEVVSIGTFTMSFKSMVPIYQGQELLGIIEVITHFNSLIEELDQIGISSLVLADKRYRGQLKKNVSKTFVDDYYVVNFVPDNSILALIKGVGVEELIAQEGYLIHNDQFVVTRFIRDHQGGIIGYYLQITPLSAVEDSGLTQLYQTILIVTAGGLLVAFIIFYMIHLSRYSSSVEAQVKARTAELLQAKEGLEKLTEELREAKEYAEKARSCAEQANQAKSLFLANMSHEIRTPMNAVLGFAEVLMELEQEEEKRSYIERILVSGNALLRLINDVLDLSKIEAGKLELEYTPVALKALPEEMQAIFSKRLQDKGLSFTQELDPQLPASVLLDNTRLPQVLINLVGNAVKFTSSGGVELAISKRPSPQEQSGLVNISIAVKDSGLGIAEGDRQRIFECFTQARGQKVGTYGGTGLGLAICQRLVDLMGGRLLLVSTPDLGSTFTVELDSVEIGPDLVAEEQKGLIFEQVRFEPATLLVVDDVDFNRELIRIYLKQWPFTIHEAVDGKEALALMAALRPDLVLLDMKMPNISGYELLEQLQGDTELVQIPIIAVTATALSEDQTKIKQLCHDYLPKPLSKTALLESMMAVLPHKQLATTQEPPAG